VTTVAGISSTRR